MSFPHKHQLVQPLPHNPNIYYFFRIGTNHCALNLVLNFRNPVDSLVKVKEAKDDEASSTTKSDYIG